ncbi:hypothetical protein [Pseudomonas sp. UV AK001]|uniref:hypothetical protein n=1 Tax=Pseudomonas sp. UV AK001 TaxID=3384791 RepID=UPI0038D3A847
MQEKTIAIIKLAGELENSLIQLKDLIADTPVDDGLNIYFKGLQREITDLATSIKKNDEVKIAQNAKALASSTKIILHFAPQLAASESIEVKNSLAENAEKLTLLIGEEPKPLKPLEPIEIGGLLNGVLKQGFSTAPAKISWDEQEKHGQRFKKILADNDFKITGLEQRISGLESIASTEIDKITALYSVALHEIEGKKAEIDNILGHVSGRAVAGDYEKSATEEKNKADWLRIGSLTCMALIAFSLGYSFWETIGTEFNWQKSLFRITLTFLLSVPAAYLARESAKHREQQYQHLQTSLDLKAISPFLASLPEEEQHKIKITIASKLFAGRDFSKTSADPFPLNTQEIIMELLKRLDFSKAQPNKES